MTIGSTLRRQRNKEHDEIFVRTNARDVTFAGGVFRQQNPPWCELNFSADDVHFAASADDDQCTAASTPGGPPTRSRAANGGIERR